MENQNKKSRYVIIGGERVFLNPAQQKAWDKFINDARNKARRNGTCGQPNYRLCFGDCACCPYQIAGRMVSMDDKRYGDGFSNGSFAPAQKAIDPDQIVILSMTVESIMREAARRERNGDLILRLRFEEGLSTYKIAERLEMRQTTVNDALNRLLRYFREHRHDFF